MLVPDYACAYCGIDDPDCVAQCQTCSKWFCNTPSATGATHLVHHLVKARHKALRLHSDAPLGKAAVECYRCGSSNVFVLGHINHPGPPPKAMLLCRAPCALPSVSDIDTTDWQPLVAERQVAEWLVRPPAPENLAQAFAPTNGEMSRLEELWRTNPDAQLADLIGPVASGRELEPLFLRFETASQYQRAFRTAVEAEADYDRELKRYETEENMNVKWTSRTSGFVIKFTPMLFESADNRLTIGDKIKLGHMGVVAIPGGGAAAIMATIIRIPSSLSDYVLAETHPSSKNAGWALAAMSKFSTGFTIEYLYSNVSYERMQHALNRFVTDNKAVSIFLHQQILGKRKDVHLAVTTPENYSVPGQPALNGSQLNAVKTVLTRPLSLIQGPPGTGKTLVSTSIVYHLARQTRRQVLVCAPSNVAVDQLAFHLAKTGLKVVRVMARSREHLSIKDIQPLTLHERVRAQATSPELKKLIALHDQVGELSVRDRKRYDYLMSAEIHRTLAAAEVVCTTCVGSADLRLKESRFRTVLIDESTQATEPECLIPIVHECQQLVLVGDHQQLGPVIGNAKARRAGLQQSLFERLFQLGHKPIRLDIQYRMHPALSDFPSTVFYERKLQDGVSVVQRSRPGLAFPWPKPGHPMMFWTHSGAEELSASGVSYLNQAEARACETLVTRLFAAGVRPAQIGIVTPYEGQRTFVTHYMAVEGSMDPQRYREVEVQSVDAFQGREKDYIIVSCVRSNQHQGIGFVRDPRRLNVALTRAKYGLIILGNSLSLVHNSLWCHLLRHMSSHDCLVEGPLNDLRPSALYLDQPAVPIDKVGLPQRNAYVNNRYVGDKLEDDMVVLQGVAPPVAVSGDEFETAGDVTEDEVTEDELTKDEVTKFDTMDKVKSNDKVEAKNKVKIRFSELSNDMAEVFI